MSAAKGGRYVYGIVRSDSGLAPPRDGVSGVGSTFLVEHGNVAALVSEVDPSGFTPRKDDLMAHAGVLERAARTTDILPWRFGTVFADERELIDELLVPKQRQLTRLLEDLADVVEIQVKATYVEDEILREVMSKDSGVKRLRKRAGGSYQDRIRLGEAVAGALEKRRREDARLIAKRIHRFGESCSDGPLGNELMVANLACLVRRDAIDTFEHEVHEMAQGSEGRITFRIFGPLPPYSFVDPTILAVA
jgi:Gas vesicle synthesis protein GvpL/GvpF